MALIDRLSWTGGIAFSSYGLRIGIRVTNRSVLDDVIDYLPPGWRPVATPTVDRLYSLVVGEARTQRHLHLYHGAEQIVGTTSQDFLLSAFQSDLHLYVAEFARRRLFVHAGVVGWRDQAIVIPGTSMSGKSTLVAALLRAGATYYSDEYAVFDTRGRVHPFPRPLSLRDGPGGRQRRVRAETLGSVGRQPLPVGLVALLRYRPGARWRPQTMSAGPAVLDLLANTIAARRRPELAFLTLSQVASSARVLKTARAEADAAATALLELIGAHP
jgi:hypothetical protein